jgi:D-alanine--poly(phosphoribitol) ligase subunit 2
VDIRTTIRDFIVNDICDEDTIKYFSEDVHLMEVGILDSISMLNLLSFLEEKFGVLLSEDELDVGNFATVQNICNVVSQKMIREQQGC